MTGKDLTPLNQPKISWQSPATMLPETEVRSQVTAGKSAAEIAARFGTSPELVEYRIKRPGLWRVYKNRGVELND
ncbi:hypothetical protein GCM10011319_40550 [Mameliella alba]|nr:hypothetical protein GCM10011319_40550 [Mameliella alba]